MAATLRCDTIQNASSSTANLTLDASGNATVGNTLAMGSSFKRNRIINGNMQVAQRGTSFTNVSNGSLTNQYTLDRWWGFRSTYASNLSMSQQAGFGGSQYCLRFGRANGDTSTATLSIGQIIESVNMVDLQGQTVTLSFFARTSASGYSGGQMSIYLYSGTTADQGLATFISGWAGVATPIVTSQSLTSTATKYTFTGTIASNALELLVNFLYTPTGTAGATDYIEITNVQLEVGSIATPYERQIYSEQLAQCQRYLPAFSGTGQLGAGGNASSTTQAYTTIIFPVPARVAATGMTINAASNFVIGCAGVTADFTCTAVSASNHSTSGSLILSTVSSGLTAGQVITMRGNGSALMYFTGCEL